MNTDQSGNGNRSGSAVSRKLLIQYGFMALPLSFAGLPIYLHAPDFYATVLGQPLASLGLVLLLLRLFDAVQDPLIGSFSDRFDTYRPFILFTGAILLGAGFWMLFHPATNVPLIWFAASVLICTTGYSIVAINLQTLGGLWQTESGERTRVTGAREALGLVGLLTASVAPPLLVEAFQFTPKTAFNIITLAYLPLLAIGLWLLLSWRRYAILSKPAGATRATRWHDLIKDRWFRIFVSLTLLGNFASAIPAVLVLFFIRDRLGGEAYAGLFLLTYFISGVFTMPLWSYLAKRLGKVRAWQIGSLLAVVTFVWAAILGSGDFVGYALVCILSGMAIGADLAIPPALLADRIEHAKQQGEASRLFSGVAFVAKFALAGATGIALPALGLLGYQPGQEMTPDLLLLLSLAYAAIPCLLKLVLFVLLICYQNTLESKRECV